MSRTPNEEVRLVIRKGLVKDLTSRELSLLFFFAQGCIGTELMKSKIKEDDENYMITGIVKFESMKEALIAKEFLNGRMMEDSNVGFEVEIMMESVGASDKESPISSTVSSISSTIQKNEFPETPSSGSSLQPPHHPQTSRFAQYCNTTVDVKNNDWMHSFYGTSPAIETVTDMWPSSPGFSYNLLLSATNSVTNPTNASGSEGQKNSLTGENVIDEWKFQSLPNVDTVESVVTDDSSVQLPMRFNDSLGINVTNAPPNGVGYVGASGILPGRHKSAVQNHRLMHHSNTISSLTNSSNGQSSLMSPQTAHFVPNSPNGFVVSPKMQPLMAGMNGLQITNPAGHPYFMNSSCGYGFGSHLRNGAPFSTNPADQNPPCNTLYVGNLPLSTSEEELRNLFSRQPGYRRLCYRTKSNGPMCFVEFEDVNYAMKALGLLQGVCLSSSVKGGIRLSFSKNPLGVRSNANPNLLVNHYGIHHNAFSPSIHTHSGFTVPPSTWTGMNQQLLGK